jgi:PAS domain S-box-containing protein
MLSWRCIKTRLAGITSKASDMVIVLFILISLMLGLGAWGVSQYRRQDLKMQTLKHSLLEINQKTHEKEEAHTKNQAQWEQTEEKLRSFLLLMDTLMNTIPNPIYFKDAEGVYQGCNKVFAKQILGLTRDRIIGARSQDLPDQIPPDLATVYRSEELRMIEKGEFHAFEAPVLCADNQRRDFLFSLAPVPDHQEGFSGSVAVLSDLTDKNRAAQDRIRKEKLEGVLETAGAVCHEFNQPLQALSGYTELLDMQLAGREAHGFVEKLTIQIERMRNITDHLQGITRYETLEYSGSTKIIDLYKASEKG